MSEKVAIAMRSFEKTVEEAKRAMTELDREIREFREQKSVALNVDDVMTRYDVGKGRAYAIIAAAREYSGSMMPPGKILPQELFAWENKFNIKAQEGA